ncbi:hypothetical protein PWT90_01188 [Aphanocladium album]|nr:hypothetical protein PWT90_01188 [Aphanocladium album]
METLISLPINVGPDRSLLVKQQPKNSGLFGILQSITSGSFTSRSGNIYIQHIPAGEKAVVDVCADHRISHDVQNDLSGNSQSIVVTTEPNEPVDIFVRLPKGEKGGFEKLRVEAGSYNIKSEVEMPNIPDKATHLSLDDVDFVPAREFTLSANSGAITGLLPAQDSLEVTTTSGSIGFNLLPLFKQQSHAAKVQVRSNSGSIGINKNLDATGFTSRVHFPSRDSSISIASSSGSIRAIFGLTKSASIKSNSGSQNITALLTDRSRDRRSDFSTASNSGTQTITVVASQQDTAAAGAGAGAETGFVCKHKANSGSIKVAYPAPWDGTVDAHANSGSISVTGGGVEVDKARGRVTGVKGTPEHHTDVGTNSGSISVKYSN